MKKNLFMAPLALLVALVLGSCSGEKEAIPAPAKPANPKAARTIYGISYGFNGVSSNGRINFAFNAACSCYKGQVTVYAYNGTGSEMSSPYFVVGRVYTTSPIITYSAPSNSSGNNREFIIESINSVSNGSTSGNGAGQYSFGWFASNFAGEFWPAGMTSTVTFTVKSTTGVGSEASWAVYPQSPYTTTFQVYGDDNVTFAKQY